MPTELLVKGSAFEIRAWSKGGRCQVLGFLQDLETSGDADADRLLNLLKRTAEHGVTRNHRQVRSLGDDIFEFKAANTARIMFFYDKGSLIICSHGFTGKRGGEKKFIASQKGIAIRTRDEYFSEKG